MEKNCSLCSKPLGNVKGNKKLCDECSKKNRRERDSIKRNTIIDSLPEVICKGCGKSFKRDTLKQKFCSKDCSEDYYKPTGTYYTEYREKNREKNKEYWKNYSKELRGK